MNFSINLVEQISQSKSVLKPLIFKKGNASLKNFSLEEICSIYSFSDTILSGKFIYITISDWKFLYQKSSPIPSNARMIPSQTPSVSNLRLIPSEISDHVSVIYFRVYTFIGSNAQSCLLILSESSTPASLRSCPFQVHKPQVQIP